MYLNSLVRGEFQYSFVNWHLRNQGLLLFAMVAGVLMFLPGKNGQFHPVFLIFVLVPGFVILLSWLYLRCIVGGFRVKARHMPQNCLEREEIEVAVEVEYRLPIPFSNAYLTDTFPAVDIFTSPEISLFHEDFSRTGTALAIYRHKVNRGYGEFNIGPVEIKVEDPFGLFSRTLKFDVMNKLQVWLSPPPPEDLDLLKENALTPMGDSRSTMAGHGMDFYGIKEYVPGDDIRAISWLKTAQAGRPVIKQFERDTRPDVFVAVHSDKNQLRGFGFGNTLKRLFRLVAALMVETQERGLASAMAICIDDQAQYLRISSSVPVYGFLTGLLGKLEAAGEGGLKSVLDLSLNKVGPGSIVFILSQTVHLDIDVLLHTMLTLQARGATVSLWAIDDAEMVRFSTDQKNKISSEEFKQRLEEMNLKFVLLPARKEIEEV
ncbi:MAG: DUF58 domain-containing protein [Candidatus Rifleibacteriota bacterium]